MVVQRSKKSAHDAKTLKSALPLPELKPESSLAPDQGRLRPFLHLFYALSISRKQFIALIASELISIVGLSVGGRVADSYNATIVSLRKIVTQVQTAAKLVVATTSNSEVSVQDLSAEALRQAQEIAVDLERIEEMSNSIRAVAVSAQQAEAAVQQATLRVKAVRKNLVKIGAREPMPKRWGSRVCKISRVVLQDCCVTAAPSFSGNILALYSGSFVSCRGIVVRGLQWCQKNEGAGADAKNMEAAVHIDHRALGKISQHTAASIFFRQHSYPVCRISRVVSNDCSERAALIFSSYTSRLPLFLPAWGLRVTPP